MSKYLVVGAGISGSSIAACLSDDGSNKIVVIDKNPFIGGNCYDYRDSEGIMVHKYGSHIFHTSNSEVWKFVTKYSKFNTYMHKVVAVIEGIEIPIPFNFDSIHKAFPESLANRIECKLLEKFEYGKKIPIKDFMNQDDEDLRFLANYIYENVFLHYTEKQWGIDPSKVDGAVTARVPVHLSRDCRYFQDKYQGIPLGGYTELISKMLDKPNIELRLNTNFKDVDCSEYDHIYYSGSIDELLGYCYGQLPYRSVHFELETYDREFYQSGATVNYPNNYDFTRIHEYKYYLGDTSLKTTIAKEYSEQFILGKNERYYPISSEENEALYKKYLSEINVKYPNMTVLGRLGDYKYYDMDKAIARALELCGNKS